MTLAVLAYELVLALTVPPNNWDALTYHLARAAAWAGHGGIYWIPNAPTGRLNEFQPLAEQGILYLIVATGSGALFALPQYVAELAILVAVYGSARRLGFPVRAAAFSAFLFATFTLVALEATTAQNDLVAASLPAAAACLLLGAGVVEWGAAGAALGFGLGVKLTTALVLPVLAWLALLRGRKAAGLALAGAAIGFVAVGVWGFALNHAHTGHLLGYGQGRVQDTTSPSWPGSVATAVDVLYMTMDLSAVPDRLIHVLIAVGAVAAVAVAGWSVMRGRRRRALPAGAAVALPFVAPLLVIGAGGVLAYLARWWGFPVRGRGGFIGSLTHAANEDVSAFGPLGIVTLAAAIVASVVAVVRRRGAALELPLALALPTFVLFLALGSRWNPFLTRFLLVPAALTAPLLARLFRDRAVTAAYLVVAALTVGLTLQHDRTKPLSSAYGRPWQLDQAQALDLAGDPASGDRADLLRGGGAAPGLRRSDPRPRRAGVPALRAAARPPRRVPVGRRRRRPGRVPGRPLLRRDQHRPEPVRRPAVPVGGLDGRAARGLLAARDRAERRRGRVPGLSRRAANARAGRRSGAGGRPGCGRPGASCARSRTAPRAAARARGGSHGSRRPARRARAPRAPGSPS